FFKAEDGIRDDLVTGVQTCALPIYAAFFRFAAGDPEDVGVAAERLCGGIGVGGLGVVDEVHVPDAADIFHAVRETGKIGDGVGRSEERRVGKECRSVGLMI